MVNKIHCDRGYCDTLSFSELQDMAAKEKELPPPEDSQELLGWIAALENADPGRMIVDTSSQATTVSRTSTVQTPMSPSVPPSSRPGISVSPPRIHSAAFTVDKSLDHNNSETPITPPVAPTQDKALRNGVLNNVFESTPKHRKRASESYCPYSEIHPSRTKVRRQSAEQVNTTGPTVPSSRPTYSSNNSQREVLTDISTSSPRRNSIIRNMGAVPPRLVGVNSMFHPSMEEKTPCPNKPHTSSRNLLQTTSASFSLPSSHQRDTHTTHTSMATQSTKTHPQLEATSTHSCKYLQNACNLTAYSFLLSPCIANFPWVTEDLLSCHGVRDFIRDPAEWSCHNHGPPSTAPNKKKMVILVDGRRQEATRLFLRQVADANLTRRNGEKRWVDVYDWRVLEDLRREEEKVSRSKNGGRGGASGESSAFRGIWRKFWVGLA